MAKVSHLSGVTSHEEDLDESVLRIELLGGFRVTAGDIDLRQDDWNLRNAERLVQVLALAPDYAMLREQLVVLFWPEADITAGANRLRQTLHVARRQLRELPLDPTLILRSQGNRVQLYRPEQIWTDVHAFEDAARLARDRNDPEPYWDAIKRYTAPLLPDELYEEWTISCRDELAATYHTLLDTVAWIHEERREYKLAIEASRRLTADEPEHEAAHHRLMRLYAATGRRKLAMRQYQTLVEALRESLDVAPEPATQKLYQDIKADLGSAAETGNGSASHNLPHPITSFIGRKLEVAAVIEELPRHRLMTLMGPGGIGKTRLAIEVAGQLVDEYCDGVWLIELAGITDPQLVPQTVMGALGIDAQAGRTLLESLVTQLKDAELLLVLDNCEHVIDASTELVDVLLRTSPTVQVLATSREALRLEGEHRWPVPALTPPDPSFDLAAIVDNDAVKLFLDRVERHQQHVAVTSDNAEAICTICQRLEGVPLALELAAARTTVLTLPQLASRLDNALEVLTAGSRVVATRQQTLTATLDWSYHLLEHPEQILLRRLAVFAGGWTLEMAESICSDSALPRASILEILGQLANKSLILSNLSGPAARYRFLEPIRQYAMALSDASGETSVLRDRHARYFVSFLESIEPELTGPGQADWFDRIELEHDNVRAALHWLIQQDDAERALRIEAVVWRFWGIRWHSSEGLSWIEDTLSLRGAARTLSRARAATGAGELARRILDFDRAIALLEEALDISRSLNDPFGIAWSLAYLANALGMAERFDESRARARESLPLFRELDDKLGQARTLNTLAEDARLTGDYATAATYYREALGLDRQLGDEQGMAIRLHNLGYVGLHDGDVSQAVRSFGDGYALSQKLGYQSGSLSFLEGMAASASAAGLPELSARLYGAWQAHSVAPGAEFKLHPPDQAEFDRYTERAATTIGRVTFDRAWRSGGLLSFTQAIAEALAFENAQKNIKVGDGLPSSSGSTRHAVSEQFARHDEGFDVQLAETTRSEHSNDRGRQDSDYAGK